MERPFLHGALQCLPPGRRARSTHWGAGTLGRSRPGLGRGGFQNFTRVQGSGGFERLGFGFGLNGKAEGAGLGAWGDLKLLSVGLGGSWGSGGLGFRVWGLGGSAFFTLKAPEIDS